MGKYCPGLAVGGSLQNVDVGAVKRIKAYSIAILLAGMEQLMNSVLGSGIRLCLTSRHQFCRLNIPMTRITGDERTTQQFGCNTC
eukprot:2694631-Karenia_brevis.AAC.1